MDRINVFKCPVCQDMLFKDGNSFKCKNRHSYDISSAGYVNLAMNQSGKTHGDDSLMVISRREFLQKGYYQPLRYAVCEAVKGTRASTILDAGCGEGYYTLEIGALGDVKIYGIDISKKAVTYASKACKGNSYGTFCVGSVYSMPYCNGVFDAVVNIFSPLAQEEYERVLKPCGYLILAVPNPHHLIELKRAVYDEVHIKPETPDEIEGFEVLSKNRVNYVFTPKSSDDISNLFSMTPYYYTTPQEKRDRLKKCPPFSITADFSVIVYRKLK